MLFDQRLLRQLARTEEPSGPPQVHLEQGRVRGPALLVHGGAGSYERARASAELPRRLTTSLEQALEAGWPHCLEGEVLPAVVETVAVLELDGAFNAGVGSVPNTAGGIEMDGGVMDSLGSVGAVAALEAHSAVRAAHAVASEEDLLLLAGAGATAFARAAGVPELDFLARQTNQGALSEQGTVGAVALGPGGELAAASSTGGRAGQPWGRVGDTAIAGAGFWADEKLAVAATGFGEAFVLAGFARLVTGLFAGGSDLGEALVRALAEVNRFGGSGGAVAVSSEGLWAAAWDTLAMARGRRHGGGSTVSVL